MGFKLSKIMSNFAFDTILKNSIFFYEDISHRRFFEKVASDIIFRCVPGVCSDFNPGISFYLGFSHPDANYTNFNPNLVSCTNLMPTSHPDPQIAGKPALGSKCSIEW